jgi:hypothetical protein
MTPTVPKACCRFLNTFEGPRRSPLAGGRLRTGSARLPCWLGAQTIQSPINSGLVRIVPDPQQALVRNVGYAAIRCAILAQRIATQTRD